MAHSKKIQIPRWNKTEGTWLNNRIAESNLLRMPKEINSRFDTTEERTDELEDRCEEII